MNSETIRPHCLAMIALSVIAIGASTAGRAQPKSFDGAYKGSWECEQTTASGIFRAPLSIIVRDGRMMASTPAVDPEGRPTSPDAMATGTIDPDGAFRVGYTLYTSSYSIRGDYSGTLSATGGTLTGTQVLTRESTRDDAARTCKGTFLFAVELPRR